jgi:SAM-dependent methyltransferase
MRAGQGCRASVDGSRIAAALRETFQTWDEASAHSAAVHGAQALVRQEAHRLRVTMGLLGDAAPARVLEIGTGYLTLAIALRRTFARARITGVEHPARAYVFASAYGKRLAEETMTLVAADLAAGGLPFRDAAFDSVVFAEVVEHLPPNAVPAILHDIARVLAPGGRLVLTTPNLASWTNRELVMRGHSPQQTPARQIDGTFGHLRLYTMAELVSLLQGAGLHVRRQEFFDQVPVAISPLRRALGVGLRPARWRWPALRDTCAVVAERAGPG